MSYPNIRSYQKVWTHTISIDYSCNFGFIVFRDTPQRKLQGLIRRIFFPHNMGCFTILGLPNEFWSGCKFADGAPMLREPNLRAVNYVLEIRWHASPVAGSSSNFITKYVVGWGVLHRSAKIRYNENSFDGRGGCGGGRSRSEVKHLPETTDL